jgi:hypothetical protein
MQAEVRTFITKVCEQRRIDNPMTTEDFLNPEDEVVQDEIENVGAHILEMFAPEEEEDEPRLVQEEVRKETIEEALKGLEALLLWEEQSEEADPGFILRLERQRRIITTKKANADTQGTLGGWLKKNLE